MPQLAHTEHLRIPGFMDAQEVAELWHVHPETVKRYVRMGLLPAVKRFGKWLVPEHVARARELPQASWLAEPLTK